MAGTDALAIGRTLRRPGPPKPSPGFPGVQVDDPRFAAVVAEDAELLVLYEGTLHGEGTVWVPSLDALLWSDVANRRLLRWDAADGAVTVAVEGTFFMNGNALDREGRMVHCEHGRRCISRSAADAADVDEVRPLVTHYEGRRLNSPNDVVVAADGTIWFTDPAFGILMPNQGSLAPQELDHQSVYRFEPETGALERMADFEQPNGLAFSPDGFRVDARGWVWTTAGDGVHVWSADGKRLGFIPTPAVAANCCFGGANGRRLFIAADSYLLAIDLR